MHIHAIRCAASFDLDLRLKEIDQKIPTLTDECEIGYLEVERDQILDELDLRKYEEQDYADEQTWHQEQMYGPFLEIEFPR